MLARTGQLRHPHLHDGVYVRREISNDQAAYYQVMHLVTPPLKGFIPDEALRGAFETYSLLGWSRSATGRRSYTVHAQVLHHLPVLIGSMHRDVCGLCAARRRDGSSRRSSTTHTFKGVCVRDRPYRLVIESKRGLKGSNNLIFARQLGKRGWINIGL